MSETIGQVPEDFQPGEASIDEIEKWANQEHSNVVFVDGEGVEYSVKAYTDHEFALMHLDPSVVKAKLDDLMSGDLQAIATAVRIEVDSPLHAQETYDDILEEEIIAKNSAAARLLLLFQEQRSSEKITLLNRVVRNTIAAQAFQGKYESNDPQWEVLSRRF